MRQKRVFERELDKLREYFLQYGGMVEENLNRAVMASIENNMEMAEKVIEIDKRIDQMEVDLEEECLKILALHQPLAIDLRLIITILKSNSDLERVGDLAVSIAEHARLLEKLPKIKPPFDFCLMAEKTSNMLRKSLDALVKMNAQMAAEVRFADDEVDDINREMYTQVQHAIRKNPDDIDALVNYIGLSRCLERVADLATNIAEDVIYLVEGTIVRHIVYKKEAPLYIQ